LLGILIIEPSVRAHKSSDLPLNFHPLATEAGWCFRRSAEMALNVLACDIKQLAALIGIRGLIAAIPSRSG